MRRDRAGRPLARRRQPDERRAGEARAVIAIRAARPEDAAAIAAIYAPHVTSGTASFEIEAPDSRAMRSRMASSDGLYPWMVVTNGDARSEEHTSELQSQMRNSYTIFCSTIKKATSVTKYCRI